MGDREKIGIPRRSALLLAWFLRYSRRYVARHFTAVRLLEGAAPPPEAHPLLVVANHPSWWDPMICLLLAGRLFPNLLVYAPMDAAALARYRFFGRLGFFGIEPGSPRGGAVFLRTGRAILSAPGRSLWVTAQGGFTDPRVRPTLLEPGVGRLLRRLPDAVVLPLALEYPFWNQRLPEALVCPGEPLQAKAKEPRSAEEWTAAIAAALEAAQERLALASIERDPARFRTLLEGKLGVGGVYDLWRRLCAALRGQRFSGEHRGAER